MENIKNRIKNIANKYNLQLAYVFGNRAKQALKLVEGKVKNLPPGTSDLDIGISRISLFLGKINITLLKAPFLMLSSSSFKDFLVNFIFSILPLILL